MSSLPLPSAAQLGVPGLGQDLPGGSGRSCTPWQCQAGLHCNMSPPSTEQVQLIPAAAAALPRHPHACAVASGPAQGWSGEL